MTKRLIPLYVFLYPYEKLWAELLGQDSILKPYRIVGLLILMGFVVRRFSSGEEFKVDRYDFGFFAIILGGLALAGFWYVATGAANLAWAVNDTALLFFVFLLYVVMKNEVDSYKLAERTLLALLAGALSSFLFTQGFGVDFSKADRAHGFFKNPNALGVLAGLSIIIVVARFLFARLRFVAIEFMVAVALCMALGGVLLTTGSRTPLISLAVGLSTFAVAVYFRRGRARTRTLSRMTAVVPLVAVVGIAFALLASTADEGSVLWRYSYDAAKSGSGRFDIWRSAWNLSEDTYFIGVGAGQYRFHHLKYVRMLAVLYSRGTDADHLHLGTHNDFINLLTCYGFPLLCVYLAMMGSMLRNLVSALRAPASHDTFLVPALLGAMVFILVNQVGHNMMQGVDYFMVMALASSPLVVQKRAVESKAAPAHLKSPLSPIDARRPIG